VATRYYYLGRGIWSMLVVSQDQGQRCGEDVPKKQRLAQRATADDVIGRAQKEQTK
jgi:hypothetical protein